MTRRTYAHLFVALLWLPQVLYGAVALYSWIFTGEAWNPLGLDWTRGTAWGCMVLLAGLHWVINLT